MIVDVVWVGDGQVFVAKLDRRQALKHLKNCEVSAEIQCNDELVLVSTILALNKAIISLLQCETEQAEGSVATGHYFG